MAHYIISYDLHNERTYPPVWKKLEGWGGVRLLESLWLVSSPYSASVLRDELKAVTDTDDSIAVVELKNGSYWATQRAKGPGVDWLKQNILA